jgi:hypothetical protein
MMSSRIAVLSVLVVLLGLTGCREPDGPGSPVLGGARLLVTSDPSGARIYLDQRDTGLRTPDTVRSLSGSHVLRVELEADNALYDYLVQLSVPRVDTLLRLHAPLTLQCPFGELTPCYSRLHRYHDAAGMRFATHALGGLLMRLGSGQGLFWPGTTTNSYVSGGIPVIAGRIQNVPISLGIFDHHYHAARPAPTTRLDNGWYTVEQESWIVPPLGALQRATARGVAINQQIMATEELPGVVFIRLRFRNVTNETDYQQLDPFVAAAGVTISGAYIGLLLDPDVGESGDDWLSYDPELDMVYAYDARFSEPLFAGAASTAPGLVGMRVLRAPEGTQAILNGWMSAGSSADWRAGQTSEWFGLELLSGAGSFSPVHSDPRIGHLPPSPADARIAVSAGPLNLTPGSTAELVIAIALADPAPGTFQSGTLVQPGNPSDTSRDIHRIAALLRDQMRAAEAIQLPD